MGPEPFCGISWCLANQFISSCMSTAEYTAKWIGVAGEKLRPREFNKTPMDRLLRISFLWKEKTRNRSSRNDNRSCSLAKAHANNENLCR